MSARVLSVALFVFCVDAPILLAAAGPLLRSDLHGDPLPARALSRLGSLRLLHGDFVTAATFSADGKQLASAAINKTVTVWQWPSGKKLHTFAFEKTFAPRLRFSPDGRSLAAFAEKRFTVWNLANGKPVLQRAAIRPPTFSSDGKHIAWLTGAHTFAVHDLSAAKDLPGAKRTSEIKALGYDPAGRLLLAEHHGKGFSLFDMTAQKRRQEVDLGKDSLLWVEFNQDGSFLGVQTQSLFVVLDARTGKQVQSLTWLPWGFVPTVLARDGRTLLLQSTKSAILWIHDLKTDEHTCTVDTRASDGAVGVADFSPDGKMLVGGSTNHPHGPSFWSTKTGKRIEIPLGHRSPVLSIAFSPDGKEIATATMMRGDPIVRLWDPVSGRLRRSFEAHPFGVCRAVYTPDGTKLITCGLWSKENVRVWDAKKLTKIQALRGHYYGIGHLAVSPDGKRLVTVGAGTTPDAVVVHDLETGDLLDRHPSLGQSTQGVTFLPDNRTVAICNFTEIRSWTPNIEPPHPLVPRPRKVDHPIQERQIFKGNLALQCSFSPDGRTIAVADAGRPARLIETLTGKMICTLGGGLHRGAVAFAPDGRTIFIGCGDGSIRLFDWPTGKECLSIAAHTGGVARLAVSPDGKRIASVGNGAIESASVLVFDVADRMNRPLRHGQAGAKELADWCAALADENPRMAYEAVWALVGRPRQAIDALKRHGLKPRARLDIAKAIKDLDSDDFKVREQAEKDLWIARSRTTNPIKAALEKKLSLEQRRRLEHILKQISVGEVSSEDRVAVRAVTVLEQIGSAESLRLLRELAKGSWEFSLTQEARSSVRRLLNKHPGR